MAGNSKNKNKKKNNVSKKNVAKTSNEEIIIEENKNIKKSTLVTPKQTPKNTKATKQETKEKVEVKEEKKVEVKKNNQPISLSGELKILKKNFRNMRKEWKIKFKKMSGPSKALIIVLIVCSIILILEGLVFSLYNSASNNSTVFHDSYNGIAVDSTGIIVVGNSDFRYSKINEYTKGNARGKLIKYKANGDLVFEKVYEKGIATSFNSIISVSDGYVVVGTGIFSKEEKENEGREAFIIKYDKEGNIIWEKFYSVITNTSFNKVKEVGDGYIAVGQSIYANMELGNHTTGGGIIVKYSKDGNELWHNNHGGTKSGNFNDLAIVNGDIYVVGKDGSDSANLVKFNSEGKYQWHKNYSYTDGFGFGGIAYLDNYLYVVGSKKILSKDADLENDRSTSNTDALLLKYDLDGNIVKEKTFGGDSYERYNSILVYHKNFYVVGHICSKNAGLRVTNNKDDEMTGLIVRYDINGNILKKETFGGSNNDNLTGVSTDGFSFYVVGYSNSGDGNITTSRSNKKDYFGKLIKLNDRFKKIYVK